MPKRVLKGLIFAIGDPLLTLIFMIFSPQSYEHNVDGGFLYSGRPTII